MLTRRLLISTTALVAAGPGVAAAQDTAPPAPQGPAVVSASSPEGVLTVSDAYGRVLAERASSAMPGSTLLAPLPAQPSIATWAGWLGPLFGWLCVTLGVILLCMGRRAAPRPLPDA